MMKQLNTHEEERIKKLYSYEILNTPADGSFDKITALAAKVFNLPQKSTAFGGGDVLGAMPYR